MQMQKPDKLSGFAKNRLSPREAEKALERAHECERQAGELLLESDEHKQRVWKYMYNVGAKHFDVEKDDCIVRCQVRQTTTLRYFIEKIKAKLSREIVDEVVVKKYEVTDIDTLKSIMRQYGVPANVLKSCLSITEKVSNKRMDDLFVQGHVTTKQLRGCYEMNESTTLTIKELPK